MKILKRIIDKIYRKYVEYKGGELYLNYLRKQGVLIGENCTIGKVRTITIDVSRPYLVEIGDQVRLNTGLTIMTHDFPTMVFKNYYGEFIPSSGKVKIGNNVYFGRNCTVLKGVTIGDNCVIGFGSLIMKDIPSNSVVAGVPAKVICSLDDYYEKRKKKSLEEAFFLVGEIEKRKKRKPIPADFREEFVFFCEAKDIDKYPEIPIEFQLTYMGYCYDKWMKEHKAIFPDFDSFIEAAHKFLENKEI